MDPSNYDEALQFGCCSFARHYLGWPKQLLASHRRSIVSAQPRDRGLMSAVWMGAWSLDRAAPMQWSGPFSAGERRRFRYLPRFTRCLFCTSRVRNATIVEKLAMNCQYHEAIPKNCRILRTVMGAGRSVMALTFSGSMILLGYFSGPRYSHHMEISEAIPAKMTFVGIQPKLCFACRLKRLR